MTFSPSRPRLIPSPHARGARPYILDVGDGWYGDPVPGAELKGRRMHAAVDCAWMFQGLRSVQAPYCWPIGLAAPFPTQTLYSFQAEGAAFLATRDYAILADEMGLGKTIQALNAAESRLMASGVRGPTPAVLILCPAIAKRHWAREVEKWTGHTAAILDGLTPGPLPQHRYIIANYNILFGQRRRNAAGKLEARAGLDGWGSVLAQQEFPIVIADEAHMLRGSDSRTTKAVKKVAAKSTCVWLLTGTPMPNHVRDLWSLWDLCSGGLAGPFFAWARAYCGAFKGQYGWNFDGSSALQELGQRLSFFMLGRSKSSVRLALPEKRREIQYVDVGEIKITARKDGKKENAVALALRATADAKRPAVVEMAVETCRAGQKVVVFAYMREHAEKIAKAVQAAACCPVWSVSGDASPESRDAMATEFRQTQGSACFVATMHSVGVAISLVGADLQIYADLTWEPAVLLQGEGRVHRHGSTNPVLVRYVIASGTIDEEIAASVVEKLAIQEAALGENSDATMLTQQLGRDMSTTEQIIDRLFARLTGG